MSMQYTDRYLALGVPYPDPETMCNGPCEGLGVYPLFDERGLVGIERMRWEANSCGLQPSEPNSENDRQRWEHAHCEAREHDCDGWHFVPCPQCRTILKGMM